MDMKAELRDWIKEHDWQIAGTLTFTQGTYEQQASRIMRNFWGRANQELYGNQAKPKRGRRKAIENITMWDRNAYGENPHFHLAIKLPQDRYSNVLSFCSTLRRHWLKACGQNYICDFEAIKNETDWINYITRKTGRNNIDNLDTYSSYICNRRSQTD